MQQTWGHPIRLPENVPSAGCEHPEDSSSVEIRRQSLCSRTRPLLCRRKRKLVSNAPPLPSPRAPIPGNHMQDVSLIAYVTHMAPGLWILIVIPNLASLALHIKEFCLL